MVHVGMTLIATCLLRGPCQGRHLLGPALQARTPRKPHGPELTPTLESCVLARLRTAAGPAFTCSAPSPGFRKGRCGRGRCLAFLLPVVCEGEADGLPALPPTHPAGFPFFRGPLRPLKAGLSA